MSRLETSSNSSMKSLKHSRKGSRKNSAFGSSITGWSCTASRSTATGNGSPIVIGFRIAALLLLFAVCVPLHILTKAALGPSGWPRRFLGCSAWICGARVRTEGMPIAPHTLLVCNHTSWLDILVLAGATGCAFVSKAELGHPLIHWMADQNGTLYVKRNDRRGAAQQAEAISRKLRSAAA